MSDYWKGIETGLPQLFASLNAHFEKGQSLSRADIDALEAQYRKDPKGAKSLEEFLYIVLRGAYEAAKKQKEGERAPVLAGTSSQ